MERNDAGFLLFLHFPPGACFYSAQGLMPVSPMPVSPGVTHLSPSDEYVIAPNDTLLLLSKGSNTLTYRPHQAKMPDVSVYFLFCCARLAVPMFYLPPLL